MVYLLTFMFVIGIVYAQDDEALFKAIIDGDLESVE